LFKERGRACVEGYMVKEAQRRGVGKNRHLKKRVQKKVSRNGKEIASHEKWVKQNLERAKGGVKQMGTGGVSPRRGSGNP